MKFKLEKFFSQADKSAREDPNVTVRKSYPIFCASARDGIVLAALNPPGMPSRIDAILDRIAYGGIGSDADILAIIRTIGVPAIWKAEVVAAPEDVLAEHLAHSAKDFITGGLRGMFSDSYAAEIVFAGLGFSQEKDTITLVDVRGQQRNCPGWVIRPEYLPTEKKCWFDSFAYDSSCAMRDVERQFKALGNRWRVLRGKSKEQAIWEFGRLRRTQALEKKFYDVFEKRFTRTRAGGTA